MVAHEELDRVQPQEHLARAVAAGHVEEQLQSLRHHVVVIWPVLEVVSDLTKQKAHKTVVQQQTP